MYQKYQLDLNKIEDQKFYNSKSDQYTETDVFKCNVPFKLKKHYHKEIEVRYFVTGYGKFTIDNDIINCKPGTLLEIHEGMIHSFEYDGEEPLEVRRFFNNDKEGYKEYYP